MKVSFSYLLVVYMKLHRHLTLTFREKFVENDAARIFRCLCVQRPKLLQRGAALEKRLF